MINNNNGKEIRSFILSKAEEQAVNLGIKEDIESCIGEKESMLNSGLFDSLTFLNLIADIEESFNLEIDLSEYEPDYFTSLGGLVEIVTKDDQTTDDKVEEKDKNNINDSQITFQEIAPDHNKWSEIGTLFKEMYVYFDTHGVQLSLKNDGEKIWLDSLAKTVGKTNHIIGAFDEDNLVGFIQSSLKIPPSFLDVQRVGVIANVYVKPRYQGRDIASQLVKLAEKWFLSRNTASIELQVLTENPKAIKFWKKMGFKDETLQMRKSLKFTK